MAPNSSDLDIEQKLNATMINRIFTKEEKLQIINEASGKGTKQEEK